MIRWSRLAITKLENIIEYLQSEWTETEVRNFKERLKKVLTYISEFPELYTFIRKPSYKKMCSHRTG